MTSPTRHVADPGLRPADVAAYARSPRTSGIEVSLDAYGGDALVGVRRARADLDAAQQDGAVYGLTTGVGALRHVSIEPDGADNGSHALRLWRSHAGGFGPELGDEVARGTMLVRLHQLLRGGSGVEPALVEALASALEAGSVPRLHAYGGIGTGDLTVLAQLGLTLVGELPWRSGATAPTPVAEGDALAFASSNALTATVGSIAVTGLAALARTTEQVAALSHLALRGSLQAYDPRVHAAKDDPYAVGVASRLTALLAGPEREAVRLQDPFGLRAVPQVHAPWEEALTIAELALAAEIGAAGENPLAVDGTALHHGQFLTQRIAATLDAVRATAVPVLSLLTARLGALLDPRLTGLPAFLAAGPQGSSGLMIVEYVAADLLSQVRSAATPVTGGHTVVSLGVEEHASHSTQAAWDTHQLLDLLPDLLACELVAAVRALRLDPSRLADCPASELFARADAALPDVRPDHIVGAELEAASSLVRATAGITD
ncbi:aromatic amino acid lyase [Nocardioides sp. URHA0020]|uniref:aromatic amino acid lyase n=1 Tax=Nocardioides sp. URHA0020 TaxID=1380392 RepID=UPI0006863BA3|nr:aromatic amino acid lyase [Nocardioides sp. URHA0020]